MFNFSELDSVHLEITNNCQASCPMCSRNFRGGLDNPYIKINEWSLDDFQNIFTEEVLGQIKNIYFCGNFGDPIINNDLDLMCEYVTAINPNLQIRIHTNGGARSQSWWKSLVKKLPKNHFVIFGIDGLEDTHHLYRIGTTYENVTRNAKAFIDAGGTADLEPPSNNQVTLISPDMIKNYKTWVSESKIDCYVLNSKEIYIDAYKKIFPCCFLASTPYNYTETSDLTFPVRQEIKKQYSLLVDSLGGIDQLDAVNVGIKNVLSSTTWQTVWDYYWNDYKLIVCARTCGVNEKQTISKPKDQFVERSGLN